MLMTLYDADILKLVPEFMCSDEAVIALSKAVNELVITAAREATKKDWQQIDIMNSAELDEFAWEMNIEWYDSTIPVENKRETVKTALALKEKSGTVSAVIEAVKAFFGGDTEIEEWFDYNGAPGHFKMTVDSANSFDYKKIIRAVNYVKRASAVLDKLNMHGTEKMQIFTGFSSVASSKFSLSMTNNWAPDNFTLFCDNGNNILTDENNNVLILEGGSL